MRYFPDPRLPCILPLGAGRSAVYEGLRAGAELSSGFSVRAGWGTKEGAEPRGLCCLGLPELRVLDTKEGTHPRRRPILAES